MEISLLITWRRGKVYDDFIHIHIHSNCFEYISYGPNIIYKIKLTVKMKIIINGIWKERMY